MSAVELNAVVQNVLILFWRDLWSKWNLPDQLFPCERAYRWSSETKRGDLSENKRIFRFQMLAMRNDDGRLGIYEYAQVISQWLVLSIRNVIYFVTGYLGRIWWWRSTVAWKFLVSSLLLATLLSSLCSYGMQKVLRVRLCFGLNATSGICLSLLKTTSSSCWQRP